MVGPWTCVALSWCMCVFSYVISFDHTANLQCRKTSLGWTVMLGDLPGIALEVLDQMSSLLLSSSSSLFGHFYYSCYLKDHCVNFWRVKGSRKSTSHGKITSIFFLGPPFAKKKNFCVGLNLQQFSASPSLVLGYSIGMSHYIQPGNYWIFMMTLWDPEWRFSRILLLVCCLDKWFYISALCLRVLGLLMW